MPDPDLIAELLKAELPNAPEFWRDAKAWIMAQSELPQNAHLRDKIIEIARKFDELDPPRGA